MAKTTKKKDYNSIEINGTAYTIAERVREESDVRMIPYSVKMYVEEVDDGEICRDPLIQRTDDQWTKKQKSKLIEAVLHNRPIGSIALAKGRAESKSYSITSLVDGLQRTTTLVDFYHDKFALDKRALPVVCRCVDENGNEQKVEIDIAGKKYSQLSDAIKTFFNKYSLTTYMHEGFSDEELDDIVFCMNNGKSPNAYQKIRFALGSGVMRSLQPICDSTLWEDVNGCKAKNDSILCCIVRTLMMMTFYNYNNLGSATMTKFVDDFDDYVKASDIANLSMLVEELAEIKMNLSEEESARLDSVTIPHYIMSLNSFKRKNKTATDYRNFLNKFWSSDNFELLTSSCESNGSGSSLYSAEMVEDRQYAIDDYMDEYLDECVKSNANEGEINDEENGTDESGAAGNIDNGDNGTETDIISDVFDTEIVSEDSGAGNSPSGIESEVNEDGNVLQGSEQSFRSA